MFTSVRVVLVGMISLATGLAIAAALALIEVATDVALYGFSAAVVIPVGAIACGFVAAGGFYVASSALHVRSVGAVLVIPAVTAVTTFFASHWFTYQWYELPTGRTYADVAAMNGDGFIDHVRMVITESGIALRSSGSSGPAVDRLGSWGYTIAALEIIGFALGGWLVTIALRNKSWCGRCGRFLSRKGREIRLFDDPEAFEHRVNSLVDVLERGGPAEAFRYARAAKTTVDRRRDGKFRLVAEHYQCGSCRTEHTVIAADRAVNNNWSRLSQTPLHIEGDLTERREPSLVS